MNVIWQITLFVISLDVGDLIFVKQVVSIVFSVVNATSLFSLLRVFAKFSYIGNFVIFYFIFFSVKYIVFLLGCQFFNCLDILIRWLIQKKIFCLFLHIYKIIFSFCSLKENCSTWSKWSFKWPWSNVEVETLKREVYYFGKNVNISFQYLHMVKENVNVLIGDHNLNPEGIR